MSHHDDNEYTPAQRRAIDRAFAQSEREYRQGRNFGPFATHAEFVAALHKEAAKLDAQNTKCSPKKAAADQRRIAADRRNKNKSR